MLCPMNVYGRVKADHEIMLEYAQYRDCDIKTASWMKECGGTVNFRVRVLVPPGKRFETTRLPHVNSLITVYVSLFGCDRKTGSIVLAVKDFSFLPRSLSSSTETSEKVAPPETPFKKGWLCPDATASPSPAWKNKRKRLEVPIVSYVLETDQDSDNSSIKSYHHGVSPQTLTLHSLIINYFGGRRWRWIGIWCTSRNHGWNVTGPELSSGEQLGSKRWRRQCHTT